MPCNILKTNDIDGYLLNKGAKPKLLHQAINRPVYEDEFARST
jgi:hypothetical protein